MENSNEENFQRNNKIPLREGVYLSAADGKQYHTDKYQHKVDKL